MSPARRLLTYALRYRSAFLLGFLCIVAATAIGLAGPWVLKLAIDDLGAGVTAGKVRGYAAALVVLALVGGVFRFLMRRIIVGVSRDIEYDLRNDFFAALTRLDLAYYHRNRTGDLMSRATNDLSAVRMMVGPAVMYTSSTVLGFILAVGLMLSIDLKLTLIALLPLPFVTFVVHYFGNAIHRRFEAIQEQLSTISAVAQEALSGVRVVRAYGRESFEQERFHRANEEYVRRNRSLIFLQGAYFPSMGALMGVAALLVLWLGSREVVAGRLTVGELVALNSYLMMLSWPMIAFGWVTNLLQRGMASWKRFLDVLDAEPIVKDVEIGLAPSGPRVPSGSNAGADSGARPDRSIKGAVEFRHLTFGYGDRIVLRDVSAVIPAGTTTAIIGATGSGKSTLLNLLPRLHEPPPGTVFVDGVDVRTIPLATLRGAIGFVPQEPFLFSATIAENVAFGMHAPGTEPMPARALPAPTRDRVDEVAALARLDKDLPDFPQGYDTTIGERGLTLSGGQKQRTALARALAVDPRILILDDALSAVDTYTEDEILTRLATFTTGRTTLLVSHRVSTVRHADQILVLDEGAIVERGTHDSLLEHGGLYARLYAQQQLEEELEVS